MSTVNHSGAPRGPKNPEDPFRYGWRYQKTVGPDGVEEFKQIPLTLEDVHHPQEEDFIMQRGGHAEDCIYLHDILQAHLGEAALVTYDLRIAWDTPEVRPLGPDVTVIFGGIYDRDRGTFDCALEGMLPTVVFEVTSPDTRQTDLGPKVGEYYLAGVAWYVIIDALGFRDGQWDLRVIGYRRTETGYATVSLDDRDWLYVEPLRLYVTVRAGQVVCYDKAGEELLNHQELSKARALERLARLKAEEEQEVERRQRAEADRQRDRERQQRAEADRLRAEAERQRVEAERQRVEAERQCDVERQQRAEAERQRDSERQQRADAERKRTNAERKRADAERKRTDAERKRADAEQQRDAERQQRVDAEQANQVLEERMRQMAAELQRLRGDS